MLRPPTFLTKPIDAKCEGKINFAHCFFWQGKIFLPFTTTALLVDQTLNSVYKWCLFMSWRSEVIGCFPWANGTVLSFSDCSLCHGSIKLFLRCLFWKYSYCEFISRCFDRENHADSRSVSDERDIHFLNLAKWPEQGLCWINWLLYAVVCFISKTTILWRKFYVFRKSIR